MDARVETVGAGTFALFVTAANQAEQEPLAMLHQALGTAAVLDMDGSRLCVALPVAPPAPPTPPTP